MRELVDQLGHERVRELIESGAMWRLALAACDDAARRERELADEDNGGDWANREATLRSWELFARYVVPELNGYTAHQRASAEYLVTNRQELTTGRMASIVAAVKGNAAAEAAMAVTMQQMQQNTNQGGGWRPGVIPTAEDVKKTG